MKLFGGGGGGHRQKTGAVPAKKSTAPRTSQPGENRKTAPRPSGKKGKVKIPLTKRQKQKRIIIIVVVIAVLCASLATAAWIFIRPPEIKNDPTIKDTENGDAVDVNSLLNSGQRVSDVFTFVVGAVDEDHYRTDALMVATMDTKKKTINIMNIPRDTMCDNNYSGASRKINTAYGINTNGKGGNIKQTKKEIEKIMGFQPDKYIIVNFEGIAAIVDAIGGIDYEVPFRMQYDDPSQNLHIDLNAGMQHLNGKQTVEFLRWRHSNDYSKQYATGDEGRVENQQKFLKALAKEVFQMKNIMKIKEIANAVFENVQTDFTAGHLLWMGMQAMQIDNNSIQFFTLPGYGEMSTAGSDPVAYSFYFPYESQTLELVNKYFNPYAEPITTLDIVSGPEGSGSSGGYTGGSSDTGDDYVWSDTTSGGGSEDSGGEETTEPPAPDAGTGDTGNTGGNTGNTGGNTGDTGSGGGDTSGNTGGDTGGDTGGNTGGDTGGNTGGDTGGDTGGNTGDTGGNSGGGDTGAVIDPEA